MRIYDHTNFYTMPELTNADARYVRDFFQPFVLGKSIDYIKNVQTKVKLLLIDDQLLPLTINNAEYNNAYVSSLYTHYIAYAAEEMYLLRQPLLEKLLTSLLRAFGAYLKWSDIDRAVYVNNWLFSTNLYTALTAHQINEIKCFLVREYPEHLIVFRSLSDYLHTDLIKTFTQCGFKLLASRQVYIAQPIHTLQRKKRETIQRDLRQIKRHGYELIEHVEPTEANIARLAQLYNKLYIDKYSAYNPQFTDEFYRHTLKNHLIQYLAVAKDGEIVGCIGYWQRAGVMTTPILGYDVDLGIQSGLYRVLSGLIYTECEQHALIGHSSSGAAEFKLNRGAIASVEYSMIDHSHLPIKRRAAIHLLRFICNKVGVRMLKGKKL